MAQTHIAELMFAEFGPCHAGCVDNGKGYSALQSEILSPSSSFVCVNQGFSVCVAAA